MKYKFFLIILMMASFVSCIPTSMTDEEEKEARFNCLQSEMAEINKINFNGFGYHLDSVVIVEMNEDFDNDTISIQFEDFSKISDGKDLNFVLFKTQQFNKSSKFAFYIDDTIPYILSGIVMEARVHQTYSRGEHGNYMGCTVKEYQLDGQIFQAGPITFDKRREANFKNL